MPQWDFLNFFAEQAKSYPAFQLRMQAEVTELIHDGERMAGVRAHTPEGILEVRADLTVGADGRHSTVREKAGPEVIDLGAPMDALWMRLPGGPAIRSKSSAASMLGDLGDDRPWGYGSALRHPEGSRR
jgi:2-polyprenyl-6-methoxyphenol hydroxylase-like FAD-dependent oxidoreductase